MSTQRIIFKNTKNQKLIGLLDVPNNIDSIKPCPAVIVAHGFKGFKEQPHMEICAKELSKAGFVAFRFDSSNGIGESDGDLSDCDLTGYLDDMKCALDFLETLDYVDTGRLGITGHSFGGQALLIVAARDERVKAIIPQCAVFLPSYSKSLKDEDGEWKKKGYRVFKSRSKGGEYKVSYHFYEDRMKYPDEWMKEIVGIIKVPTRIIHSENDEAVPLHSAHTLLELLNCEKDLHIIKGAEHTYREKQQLEEVATLVVEWFEKHLK
ncbi:prolyl oligopeptidase family serine peptidase [Candidatus Woesearchaeota archaeon]|nr:prolyl oligopeptidase family serine peptidase [Candidatus Woesearchaeota archaeon]